MEKNVFKSKCKDEKVTKSQNKIVKKLLFRPSIMMIKEEKYTI